ncbi:hypothetical protein LguiA_020832 [Lonicera macranthoides]
MAGTTSSVVTPLQANVNAVDIPSAGRPLIIVFGYEDHNVQLTDKQLKLQASTSYIGKGKGKENQAPVLVGSENNIISKATLAQRKRREREKGDLQPRQLAQRMRCDREKQNKIQEPFLAESIQPRFFPGLIPRASKRGSYERECLRIKNHFLHHPALLDPGPSNFLPHPLNPLLHSQESLSPPSSNIQGVFESQNIFSPPVHYEAHVDSVPITPSPQRNHG